MPSTDLLDPQTVNDVLDILDEEGISTPVEIEEASDEQLASALGRLGKNGWEGLGY
jgi:hypothetical protein